jgi:hypothetical protein
MRRMILVVSLFALGTFGCKGTTEITVGVDKTHYCSEVAKVVCENVFECCTGAEIEDMFGLTITTRKGKCLRDVELMCEQANPALLLSLEKGTVTVDTEAADTCLNSLIVEDSCFLLTAEPPVAPECFETIFAGTQGISKTCVYDIECQGSAYCGSDRKCKALPVANQPCDNLAPRPCDENLYCDQDNSCQPLKKGGEECDNIGKCSPQLYCDDDPVDGENVCKSQKAVGASCAGDRECQSAYCIPGLCGDGSQCYRDDDCAGTCADSGKDCGGDDDCAGTCQESGDPCLADWDCFGADDKCVHPDCLSQCIGQPVCGEEYDVYDYCQVGLTLIQGIQ